MRENEKGARFMNVACCQFDIVWENKAANFEKVRALLAHAALAKDSLVLLPEMFATGFSMNAEAIAEERGGPTEKFLAQSAQDFGICLMGGIATRGRDGLARNEAVVFSPRGIELARYCKMHPFTPGGEARHYRAGGCPIIFPWRDFSIAPFICYDLRFPEIFRPAAARGAQLITVMACWPDARLAHWVKLLQARAIENQAYVAGVNRCGQDPSFHHSGRSLIVNPHGEILADAGADEKIITHEIELAPLLKYRGDLPFLKDMQSKRIGFEVAGGAD